MLAYIKNNIFSLLKWLSRHNGCLIGLAAIIAAIILGVWQFEVHRGPKNIYPVFTLFPREDSKLLMGTIINQDKTHANEMKIYSNYCGKVINIKTILGLDTVKKEDTKFPEIRVELDKLSINNTCIIDVTGDKDFNVTDNIVKVAWGNGRHYSVKVTPPTADQKRVMESTDRANKALKDKTTNWFDKNQPALEKKHDYRTK
jgi:hypothetical protein